MVVEQQEKEEPVYETATAEQPQAEKIVNENLEQPEPEEKAEDSKPNLMEEKKEIPETQTAKDTTDDGIFKIRPTEFKSKINVVGQIDLATLNQSTRPKKKSKEERRKEREEKDRSVRNNGGR